jgi:membrane-associated protease RseP (regulator of RpoE activity)
MKAPRFLVILGLFALPLASDRLAAQDVPPSPPAPPATPSPPVPPVSPAPPAGQRLAFGFMLDDGPPLTVKGVIPGSPVARAGIRVGDVLVSVDGRAATLDSVREAGRQVEPGERVRFRIRRAGREEVVVVTPDVGWASVDRPHERHREPLVIINRDSIQALVELYLDDARKTLELHGSLDMDLDLDLDEKLIDLRHFKLDSLGELLEKNFEGLGLMEQPIEIEMPGIALDVEAFGVLPGARLVALEPDLARYFPGADRGVLVLSVRPGSRSAEAGFEAGDVIVEIDGEIIEGLSDVRRAFRDQAHEFAVLRHGDRRVLRLQRP